MPGPHKGVSTQCRTQQQYAKPRHQPSDRDQQARDRLRNKISESKAKIRSCAYLQLGIKALQTVHQTFDPNIPVIFHLLALTITSDTDTIPMLFVIQEGRHCMPTTDYYFTNIQPDSIIIPQHRGNHSEWTAQHVATKDQIPQQAQPLWPGKTRVYPSMLADKQVPVLDLTTLVFTSEESKEEPCNNAIDTASDDSTIVMGKPVTTAFISDQVCIPTEKVRCLQVTSQLQEFLDHFPPKSVEKAFEQIYQIL